MIHQIGRYSINGQVYSSSDSILYTAVDSERNQKHVVIKTINPDLYNNEIKLAKLRNEYKLLLQIQSDFVVQAYDYVHYEGNEFFVMEYVGDDSLSQLINTKHISTELFLTIAIQILRGLEDIHKQGIVHKDIHPSNIIYNPKTRSVKIIDFGNSSEFSYEKPQDVSLNAGTLKYISPEQTQRVNRPIDFRTDFYSLGVTFYEMLCGQLPFTTDSPTELIYAHIAKTPPRVSKLNPEVPKMISMIISKLMEKMPEDRYFSAAGIRHDFERCLQALNKNGDVPMFELGAGDMPDRLEISRKMYGREQELDQLLSIYDDFLEKGKCLVTIGGYSGMGKTSLVNQLQKRIAHSKGIFIKGKIDQYQQNVPCYAFFKAIEQLCDYILSESEDVLLLWRSKLSLALRDDGRLLTDKVTKLEHLVGQQPELPHLSLGEEQIRFKNVLLRLLQTAASVADPLVLFIDDIHIADLASLEILQDIMMNDNITGLLILSCYRDNEVDETHQLTHTLEKIKLRRGNTHHIRLKGLLPEDISLLISDSMHSSRTESDELATILFDKTLGNPFYLIQLLKYCCAERIITFSSERNRFVWNMESVKNLPFRENVVDFLIQNITFFSPQTVELLSFGASIGQIFDMDTLVYLSQKDQNTVVELLKPAVDAEIIRPFGLSTNENGRILFDFCHDRFQQAYYTVIPDDKKHKTHLEIARFYEKERSDGEPSAEHLLYIAEHYSKSVLAIPSDSERLQVIGIILDAVRLSVRLSAFDTSLCFVEVIIDNFSDLLKANRKLHFAVYCEYHLTLCSLAKYADGDSAYKTLTELADNLMDLTENCCIQAVSCSNRGNYDAGIELIFEMLAPYGVTRPSDENLKQVTNLEIDEFYKDINHEDFEGLESVPETEDPAQKAVYQLLARTIAATFFKNPLYTYWVAIIGARRVLKHGYTVEGLNLYGNIGFPLIALRNDHHTAYHEAKLCIEKMTALKSYGASGINLHIFSLLYMHWIEDLKNSIPYARESFKRNMEVGNLEYACFSYYTILTTLLETSNNIDDLKLECGYAITFAQKTGNDHSLQTFVNFNQFVKAMKGETYKIGDFDDDSFHCETFIKRNTQSNNMMALCFHYTLRALLAVIYSDYENAFVLTETAVPIISFVDTFYIRALHNFLHSLAICKKITSTLADKEEKRLMETLKHNQQWLKKCVQDAPMNFSYMYTTIKAEIKALESNFSEAIVLYKKAEKEVRKSDRPTFYAVLSELVVPYYMQANTKSADDRLQRTYTAFMTMGANGKCKQMRDKYKELSHLFCIDNKLRSLSVSESSENTSSSFVSRSGIYFVIEELLLSLLETSGAQNMCFVRKKRSSFEILAHCCVSGDDIDVSLLPKKEDKSLPLKVLNYVARAKESIILDSITDSDQFGTDDYFRSNNCKSILCFPVMDKKDCKGILYFENNLINGAFDADSLCLLNIIALQLAVSLDNSDMHIKDGPQPSDCKSRSWQKSIPKFPNQDEITAEDSYKLMLDSSPLSCNIWDANINMIDCNEAAVKLFELSSKAEYCEKFMRLNAPIQPNDRPFGEMLSEYLKTAVTQGECQFQWMYRKLDGELIPAEVVLKKVVYQNSFRIIGYTRDLRAELSAKAAVLEADERYRVMINTTSICFTFWDEHGNMIDCNDTAMELFEIDDKAAFIQNFFLFSAEYQKDGVPAKDMFRNVMEKVRNEGRCMCEWVHQNLLGERIPSEVTLVKVNYKDSYRIAGFARDLREHKAMLDVIKKNEEDLLAAKLTAENNANARKEFLANMSHEIRTPMNAIIGMTNIGQAADTTERMQYCFEKIETASKNLLALINDILDFSKIDSNKLELHNEPFHLEKMLENTRNVLSLKAEEKSIDLIFNLDESISCHVTGDKLRLSQVITNLVSNAIKFTPDRGKVELIVKRQSISNTESDFSFEVIDTGIGIPSDQIDKIFSVFQQADGNVTRKYGGSGLGLSISKKIVELMGGEICVSSEVGVGSHFSFTIRLAIDDQSSALDASDSEQTSIVENMPTFSQCRLLLVEDVPINQEIALVMLESLKITVDCASNGKEAVDMFLENPTKYDIILMDVQMPVMDGLTAAKIITETYATGTLPIPIIALTANAFNDDVKACKNAGMVEHICKPIDLADMLYKIAKFLKGKEDE